MKPRTINISVRLRHPGNSPQTLPSGLVLAKSSKAVQHTYVPPHVLISAAVYSGYGDPDKETMELRGHLIGPRCKTATQIWRLKSQISWNPVYDWGMFHCSCIIGDMFLQEKWTKAMLLCTLISCLLNPFSYWTWFVSNGTCWELASWFQLVLCFTSVLTASGNHEEQP